MIGAQYGFHILDDSFEFGSSLASSSSVSRLFLFLDDIVVVALFFSSDSVVSFSKCRKTNVMKCSVLIGNK